MPPAATSHHAADPSPAPTTHAGNGQASHPRASRPNRQVGLTPEEQIARRDEASRLHAATVARARADAAARALAGLGLEVGTTAASKPAASKPAAPSTPRPSAPAPTSPTATSTPAPAPASPDPLLEITPSRLATDIEHIGDRLAIFADRVELRDRNDTVRQRIAGDEITDVIVQRKLTGAVLSIEAVTGPPIVAKGLRPEQAEEARNLIIRKTRRVGPASRQPRRSSAGAAPGRPRTTARIDEADLVRKLEDLHRAGVLSDDELAEKVALVRRLARGEPLVPSP